MHVELHVNILNEDRLLCEMNKRIHYSNEILNRSNIEERRRNKCLYSQNNLSQIPPSQALLDKVPSAPSANDPYQRIISRIHRPALKIYLRILASSDGTESSSGTHDQSIRSFTPPISFGQKPPEKRSKRKLGDKVPSQSKKGVTESDYFSQTSENSLDSDFVFYDVLTGGICEGTLLALQERRLNLAEYRPLYAPFVPEIISLLVNSIESDCYEDSWEPIFTSFMNLKINAEKHACILLQNWAHTNHLKRHIYSLTLSMKLATLRVLLLGFKQKPLHFNRRLLMSIIERPLFDQFLRPNPKIKSLVRHTALPCNRTSMDTLAFLMLHLLHAWECALNPLTAKLKLAKLYGPLIISFAERPMVLDQDPTDYKSEEAAILEVVLEVCNGQFWDNLSMLRLRKAFTSQKRPKGTKLQTKHCSKTKEQEIVDSDYEYEEWFSFLFPRKSQIFQNIPEQPKIEERAQFEFNRYVDCRLLARNAAKKSTEVETAQQAMARFKLILGEEMHGAVLETSVPRIMLASDRLSRSRMCHLYIERELRSTQEIIVDVYRTSKLKNHSKLDK